VTTGGHLVGERTQGGGAPRKEGDRMNSFDYEEREAAEDRRERDAEQRERFREVTDAELGRRQTRDLTRRVSASFETRRNGIPGLFDEG
jgi:hypothetical protein